MRKLLQIISLFIIATDHSYGQSYLYGDKKRDFLHHSNIKVYGEQVDSTIYTIEVRIDKQTSYSTILDTLRGGNGCFEGKQYKIKITDNKYTLSPGNIRLVKRSFPINGDPFTKNFDLIYNDPTYWRNFDSVSISKYGIFWLKTGYIIRRDSSYMYSLWSRLTNIDIVKMRTHTNAQVHFAVLWVAFGIIQPIFFLIIYPAAVSLIVLLETEKFLINNFHGRKTLVVKLYSSGKFIKLRIRKDTIITETYKYKLTEGLDGLVN